MTLKQMADIVTQWSDEEIVEENNMLTPTADGDNEEEAAPMSSSGNESESDGEIVIECANGSDISDFSESCDDEESSDSDDADDSTTMTSIHCSPSAVLWSEEPFPVRFMNRNIVRFSLGPTFTPATEKDSFYFYSRKVLHGLKTCKIQIKIFLNL